MSTNNWSRTLLRAEEWDPPACERTLLELKGGGVFGRRSPAASASVLNLKPTCIPHLGHLQNPAIGELLRRQAVSASRASAAAALSPTAPAPSPPPPRRRDESNSGRVCLGSRGRTTAENPRYAFALICCCLL